MVQVGPFGFSGGLNTASSFFTQPRDSLYTCSGVRYEAGFLRELYGRGLVSASPMAGTGVKFTQGICVNPITPTNFPLLCVTDGKFYTMNGVGTFADVSGAAAFSATLYPFCTSDVLNGIMIISDPSASGWMGRWTGAGNVTKNTAYDGYIVKTVNNFLFAVPVNSSSFAWSNVGDPDTFSAANTADFRKSDGDTISALGAIGTDLYIFKYFSIGRLSTISSVISGSATLGPLSTVNVGVGAAGINCVDKLPDGRLIFLGSDFHAYIFDGSTLIDISDQNYPATNPQTLFDLCNPGASISGTSSLLSVQVYPPRHEAWFVVSPNPISGPTLFGSQVLIYNYLNNLWTMADYSSSGGPYVGLLRYVPNLGSGGASMAPVAAFGPTGSMVSGTAGNIYNHDIATQSTTRVSTMQWNASIQLSGQGRNFSPRSLLLIHKGTSSSGTFAVSYGWDGATIGNSKTVTTATTFTRTIIPLVLPSTGQSSVGPSSIQIQVVDTTGGGVVFQPFYLSDDLIT